AATSETPGTARSVPGSMSAEGGTAARWVTRPDVSSVSTQSPRATRARRTAAGSASSFKVTTIMRFAPRARLVARAFKPRQRWAAGLVAARAAGVRRSRVPRERRIGDGLERRLGARLGQDVQQTPRALDVLRRQRQAGLDRLGLAERVHHRRRRVGIGRGAG